jgi:phosphoglycolate phosphatase-like HAD superfamily hydrolase
MVAALVSFAIPDAELPNVDVFGATFDTSEIPFSGKTDRQIFRQALTAAADHGIEVGDPASGTDGMEGAIARFGATYRERMHATLPQAHVEALPGAVDLVHRLAATEGVHLGLLTGNLQPLAFAKVERLGLGPAEFPFGAYGSDAEDRNALPAIAIERASSYLGRPVDPAEVAVIGDTPMDIACARAGGCIAVAVATGRHPAHDLTEADVVLNTLEGFSLEALA